ncbi:MAG: NADH:flavin oxidoreductase [Planctomycetaceae bacterium]
MAWQRIGSLKTIDRFREHLASLSLDLPCDDEPLSAEQHSPLAEPLAVNELRIGNRWCVHPMEGWDGTPDGAPTDLTIRRWEHFGESGCKLIWGGEAVAVRADGRANPLQLLASPANEAALAMLRQRLVDAHVTAFGAGATNDLCVGLQLTHSGRFARPNRKDRLEPRIAYHHPILDRRFGISATDDDAVLSDGEVRELVGQFVDAARMASRAGFQFVDVKCCHGYLGHEFLSAFDRPGDYGGDLRGRSRFLREIIAGIRAEAPALEIGVRLSCFDFVPFLPDPQLSTADRLGPGIPDDARDRIAAGDYPIFGCRRDDPLTIDLREPIEVIRQLRDEHQVRLFNLTAGSPYYNPHIQRPAYYPPSDGYQPPEDPLVGCVRQIHAVREIKQAVPDVLLVGTAYSYLQEFLPHVAQAVVRAGWIDSVGIGRLVLSDWALPAKVLRGADYRADKKLCRTFSDCTTGPRFGVVSGCYPLDPLYKDRPEAELVKQARSSLKPA